LYIVWQNYFQIYLLIKFLDTLIKFFFHILFFVYSIISIKKETYREHRDAAQYALLNGNAFSCTTDAIGFSRLSAGSTTSLMQPVLRRHWRAATVSPPIYEANTPGRLYWRWQTKLISNTESVVSLAVSDTLQ